MVKDEWISEFMENPAFHPKDKIKYPYSETMNHPIMWQDEFSNLERMEHANSIPNQGLAWQREFDAIQEKIAPKEIVICSMDLYTHFSFGFCILLDEMSLAR